MNRSVNGLSIFLLSLLLRACAAEGPAVGIETDFRPSQIGKGGECTYTVTAPAELGVTGAVLMTSDGLIETNLMGRPEEGSTTIFTAIHEAEGKCPDVKAIDVHLKVLSILKDLSMECSVTRESLVGTFKSVEYSCK